MKYILKKMDRKGLIVIPNTPKKKIIRTSKGVIMIISFH